METYVYLFEMVVSLEEGKDLDSSRTEKDKQVKQMSVLIRFKYFFMRFNKIYQIKYIPLKCTEDDENIIVILNTTLQK